MQSGCPGRSSGRCSWGSYASSAASRAA